LALGGDRRDLAYAVHRETMARQSRTDQVEDLLSGGAANAADAHRERPRSKDERGAVALERMNPIADDQSRREPGAVQGLHAGVPDDVSRRLAPPRLVSRVLVAADRLAVDDRGAGSCHAAVVFQRPPPTPGHQVKR